MRDPFSDVIGLLRPHAVLSKPITGRGRWGVRYAAYGQPGFAIILAGQCWLALDGAEPLLLQQGDFILLPSTPAFSLCSEPGVPCVDQVPSDTEVRHGDPDGEPDMRTLGGAFQIEQVNASLLLSLLPAMIHIRAVQGGTERLARIIDMVVEECAADHPGRDAILERLLDVMLVECLRWSGIKQQSLTTGLLAGFARPRLGRRLARHA